MNSEKVSKLDQCVPRCFSVQRVVLCLSLNADLLPNHSRLESSPLNKSGFSINLSNEKNSRKLSKLCQYVPHPLTASLLNQRNALRLSLKSRFDSETFLGRIKWVIYNHIQRKL